jgi:hypothetical protein
MSLSSCRTLPLNSAATRVLSSSKAVELATLALARVATKAPTVVESR